MAFVIADRVRETTTTTGTGAVTLAGAYISFQSFSTAIGNGNNTYYTIASASSGEWEVGIGTYYSANTSLSRDVILASSNANAVVTLLAGSKDVFITYPSEKAVYANNSPTDAYVLTAKGSGVPPTWDPLNAALATGNSSIVLNNTNITSNATIAAGQNGISIGPVNTANGVTVTIASGQTWTIL